VLKKVKKMCCSTDGPYAFRSRSSSLNGTNDVAHKTLNENRSLPRNDSGRKHERNLSSLLLIDYEAHAEKLM
jgi:hypothetical protein